MFGINFSKYGINSAIFLIIILLLSLVLCSFLGGGNCFNSREGMTSSSSTPEQIPTNYIGTGGSSATLIDNVITTTNGGIIDTFNATSSGSSSGECGDSNRINDCKACTSTLTKENKPCYWVNSSSSTSGSSKQTCSSFPDDPAECSSGSSSSTTATEFESDKTGNTARLTNKWLSYSSQTDKDLFQYTITVSYPTSTPDPNNPSEKTTPKPNDIYTATIEIDHNTQKTPFIIPRDGSASAANYNHYSGLSYPTIYYNNEKTLRVFYANGVYYITVTDPVTGTIYYNSTAATDQASLTKYTFTGTNGGTAVVYAYNGSYAAKVTYPDGQVVVYTASGPTVSNNSEMYNNNTNTYTATSGSSGTVYSGPNATVYTTDTPYTPTTASVAYNNGYDYSSSEPQGVSRSNIPEGDEDLYMLKSQIVPPVCPACPGFNKTVNINSGSSDKCQPCPACARCPKPAFDCKKVPNYKTIDDSFLPSPVMNTAYSTYGM
jgi:hypothetical protein